MEEIDKREMGHAMDIILPDFWERAYEIGMRNGWCSGIFAMQDGDYTIEEDRLNKKSCTVMDDIEDVFTFFKQGNWCLGEAIIYKDLCFIQQVNGGDE